MVLVTEDGYEALTGMGMLIEQMLTSMASILVLFTD